MKYFLSLAWTMMMLCGNAQTKTDTVKKKVLRIIAFGAHPDDNELRASGVAALWAAMGYKVKFVALTNGDIGHFQMAGAPLAKRRLSGGKECAKNLGIETEGLGINDGGPEPTLA